MNKLEIAPLSGPVDFSIQPPGSKSITNRALICAALANGNSTLRGILDSDDTRVMVAALQKVGVQIDHDKATKIAIVHGGAGNLPNPNAEIDVEGSGTTIRFLTAALTAVGGRYTLDGIQRMRQRPIGDLVTALQELGGNVFCDGENGCPPVSIDSPGLIGGQAIVASNISSQYLSGLLMAAPLAKEPVGLQIDGELVSKPYVSMTLEVMKSFGINVDTQDDFSQFVIEPNTYSPAEYSIEPDASAASYFWAAAAIMGGRAEVKGLNRNALQGDVQFVECLEKMGCQVDYGVDSISVTGPAKHAIEIDMGNISDTVQTLAAVALFVPGTTRITNVAHNRVKETDRIGDLATELRKLGAVVEELDDGLAITPGNIQPTEIETYNDHRMAMSLSLVGLKVPGIRILDPGCVAKTYPQFFDDLKKVH